MKKFITIIVLIIFFPQTTLGTVLVNENWDNGVAPNGWPCKNIPASCTNLQFNGWIPRNFDCAITGGQESDLSTTQKYSGTRSYSQYRAAGANYACDIKQEFSDQTKIYVSFRIFFPSDIWNNWTTHPAEAGDDAGHFFFANSGLRAPNRIIVDINDSGPWRGVWPGRCWGTGGNHAYFSFLYGGDDTEFGANATYCYDIMAHLNEWHQHIWMFDRQNNKFAWWIDNSQVIGTNNNGIDQTMELTSLTSWIFSAYRSAETGVVQGYYLDDIIIATTLNETLGQINADTTPPAAPSGLIIN